VGTTTSYCVAHRLQIVESPTRNSRAFLRLQKSEMRAINTHSHQHHHVGWVSLATPEVNLIFFIFYKS
ncbi:MAG: hypothetical protein V7726_18475, partial [Pseudoalteromonas distincta]|uniref:hypothetical protein n=2 Tax=Pseudoalteromonas TaxID=53246 RepID=UPI003001B2F3